MKLFLRSFSFLPLNHSRRVVVSYKRKYVHEVLVNCLFKLAQEKVWLGETDRSVMTIAVDLGRKATKQKQKELTTVYGILFYKSFLQHDITYLLLKLYVKAA